MWRVLYRGSKNLAGIFLLTAIGLGQGNAQTPASSPTSSALGAQEKTELVKELDRLMLQNQKLEDHAREVDEQNQQLKDEIRKIREKLTGEPFAATPSSAQPSLEQTVIESAKIPPSAIGPPMGSRTAAIDSRLGQYDPAKGFVVAEGSRGELGIGVWSYFRYLNQLGLDKTYTDSFGRTTNIQQQQDFQLQKVNMTFKGWVFDPKLEYSFFLWTANTSSGDPAQTVIAGFLGWTFNQHLALVAGAGALPTTRSTQNTFPEWLKVDHRSIADEFLRGSYTTGIWAQGQIREGLKYRVMAGDNLSGLGVDASQLDNKLRTVSGAIWWMPTTKEFGPKEGYGDFEHHDKLATLLGLHYTHSGESDQEQPPTNAIENSQIRLSDGTNLFSPGAFAPGTQVTFATYKMLSADAALKRHGFSLESSYFFRWVDGFTTIGVVPVKSLFDYAFEVQASAMLKPRRLQAYVEGSKIYGQYGNPYDLSAGFNLFPLRNRNFRFNTQALYTYRSPVGYTAVPFALGGTGVSYTVDTELVF